MKKPKQYSMEMCKQKMLFIRKQVVGTDTLKNINISLFI